MDLNNFKKYWEGDDFMKKKSHPKLSYAYDACLLEYIIRVTVWGKSVDLSTSARQEIKTNLDLLDAIYNYRLEKDVEAFLLNNPKYKAQEKYVRLLWSQLDELSNANELYDIVFKCFKEIDQLRGITHD